MRLRLAILSIILFSFLSYSCKKAGNAKHDTMDPNAMEEQSKMVEKGRYLFCPNGSHLAMWDDQQIFMNGVIEFIKDVDSGSFK